MGANTIVPKDADLLTLNIRRSSWIMNPEKKNTQATGTWMFEMLTFKTAEERQTAANAVFKEYVNLPKCELMEKLREKERLILMTIIAKEKVCRGGDCEVCEFNEFCEL